MKNKSIYLDYNATTPVDPEVAEAMIPYLTNIFGNPSSNHSYGMEAKMAIDKSREQLSELINCEPGEIIFTSGGTESNNFALKGSAFQLKDKGNQILTSSIEHPAILEVCQYLESHGFKIIYLPVDKYGVVLVEDLEKAINPKTILITIMHANNEIGTVQSIEEIGKIAKKNQIRLHTDAAQSIGKVIVDVNKMQIDLLSIAGHKLYAPKGIGALYIKKGTKLEKFMHGASHEFNFRAGTENVSGIVGLGKATEIAKRDFDKNFKHQKELKNYLYMKLKENIPEIHLNGHPEKCLPNTLSISFPGKQASALLQKMEGIAASAGAACHSEGVNISQTLKAIGLLPDLAFGTIRFSTGKNLDFNDIDKAIEIIIRTFNRIG
jgi:cysteine desulfurase